jgi:hypothetical protein
MVEMVGAAFEASGKMENLPPGADELGGSRDLTQLTGDLSIMLGTGRAPFHYGHQCQAIHINKVVSTAVQKIIPSAVFARSPRVGRWASWLAMNSRWSSIRA